MPYVIVSTEPNPVVALRAEKLRARCIHGVGDKLAVLRDEAGRVGHRARPCRLSSATTSTTPPASRRSASRSSRPTRGPRSSRSRAWVLDRRGRARVRSRALRRRLARDGSTEGSAVLPAVRDGALLAARQLHHVRGVGDRTRPLVRQNRSPPGSSANSPPSSRTLTVATGTPSIGTRSSTATAPATTGVPGRATVPSGAIVSSGVGPIRSVPKRRRALGGDVEHLGPQGREREGVGLASFVRQAGRDHDGLALRRDLTVERGEPVGPSPLHAPRGVARGDLAARSRRSWRPPRPGAPIAPVSSARRSPHGDAVRTTSRSSGRAWTRAARQARNDGASWRRTCYEVGRAGGERAEDDDCRDAEAGRTGGRGMLRRSPDDPGEHDERDRPPTSCGGASSPAVGARVEHGDGRESQPRSEHEVAAERAFRVGAAERRAAERR